MPTRLAAGLGLESDLRFAPLRPGPGLPDFGSPASGNVSPDLGCGREHPKNGGRCQTRGWRRWVRLGLGALASSRRVSGAKGSRKSPARGQRSQDCATVTVTPGRVLIHSVGPDVRSAARNDSLPRRLQVRLLATRGWRLKASAAKFKDCQESILRECPCPCWPGCPQGQ